MLFSELVKTQMEKVLIPEIEDLLRLKEKTSEMGLAPKRQIINDYIESSLAYLSEEIEKRPTVPKKQWPSLNNTFLKALDIKNKIVVGNVK
jgi:predicted nucleotidyltransferase